ncbi:hypothetical protein QBC38DRAFT_494662 [Podospora fimiseda]|uniref:Uncharacterized protein n=1 Tax=Podospora fimiseda TaxID=252190 RepID=A0AAN7C0I4_9PEZI|nr:hypothetical protein QBC38DRAFT_494662 [Podospora fimiseda]
MQTPQSKLFFSLFVFCLSCLSSASAFPKQTATADIAFAVDGWSPTPTSPPFMGLWHKRGSNTCGYISAEQNKPIICGEGYTCTTDTGRKRIGCCAMTGDSRDCVLGDACYDLQAATSCKDNSNCSPAMLCTETGTPYCNTYSFEDNHFTDFFCHTAALGMQKGRTDFITPSGLSRDEKIAVGVAVGVGAPTISFLIAFIFILRL